jgi:8-oxo-dGTP pyrophosphatase MutT (NUDIX family)
MQDASKEGDRTAAAPPHRDWTAIIRARLAGTVPRHAHEDWLIPGLFEPGDAPRRWLLPPDPVPAAVLIPLVERPDLTVLFTQRATQLRNHAGQISFPGGRIEPGDRGPAAAATREAREEIGLDQRFVSVIGYLPDHVVITGFRITPVVAFLQRRASVAGDEVEFREIPFGERTIWGATAGMLHTLYRVCTEPQVP